MQCADLFRAAHVVGRRPQGVARGGIVESATIEIQISLPLHDGHISQQEYVKAALKKIAQSFIDNGNDVEQAAIYGNWDYTFVVNQHAYQPTLWE
jgi:hypothetical protein